MELKPCTRCKGNNTLLDHKQYWTGMSYKPLSVELRHWCEDVDDSYVKRTFFMRCRDEQQAVDQWNKDNG